MLNNIIYLVQGMDADCYSNITWIEGVYTTKKLAHKHILEKRYAEAQLSRDLYLKYGDEMEPPGNYYLIIEMPLIDENDFPELYGS